MSLVETNHQSPFDEFIAFVESGGVGQFFGFLLNKLPSAEIAEDIAQETYLRAWQKLPEYENRGAPISSWIYKIAHNLIANFYRDTSRHPTYNLESLDGSKQGVFADPIDRIELDEALCNLPQTQREAIILHHLQGFTAEEVATAFKTTIGAARARIHRGLENLKEILATDDQRYG